MPSIKIETSAVLSVEQKEKIALQVSSSCAQWLGKPENVVQVRIEDGLTVSFGGTVCKDSAFIVIALIGEIDPAVKSTLPAGFADILKPCGIDPKRIFIRYMESGASAWGWN